MSSSPQTMVDTSINGTGVVPKARYPKESGGSTPPSHAGICLGARSVCGLSLLNSRRTRRGMQLTDRLERLGGHFLDSTSILFFEGSGSESGELPKDSSSSAAASLSSYRIGSCLYFVWLGVVGDHFLVHFRPVHLLGECASGRFPAAYDQHGYEVRPSIWHIPLASPPCLGASKGTDLRGTGSLGC